MKSKSFPSLLASFLVLPATVVFLSCQLSQTSKPDTRSESPVPSDFRFLIGEGGGFTGRWDGYLVDSAGTVFSWSGTLPGQNTKRITMLPRHGFERLWKTIVDARFFEIDTVGSGNMTRTIHITAGGTEHRASWAHPSDTRSRLAPVQVLYDSCLSIVSRFK